MADKEHLEILNQGVEVWNKWREANPEVIPVLVAANFSGADLRDADLRGAKLWDAILIDTNLTQADLRNTNLRKSSLVNTNLVAACLSAADLAKADLRNAVLDGAILEKANLYSTDLSDAGLSGAYLGDADLSSADISSADINYAILSGANLTNADLSRAQALFTDFEGAILTGTCIEDWHINACTNLNGVICDYVYLRRDPDTGELQERRPSDPNKNFAPGEFTALFQKALETVDLIFADGIDWKAFFQSFQELQSQYADKELSIQAIEKKPNGAFVIRLETPDVDVDKAAIETAAMEKYQAQLKLLEVQYRNQLHAKDIEIESYRRESANMMEITKLLASRPVNVEANAVSNSQSSGDTYNGNIKATNFAPHGTAIGGTFNDYSQTITNNLDEIGQLITTLRSQAEQFPPDARSEVLEHLNDLQEDLKHPDKVKPSRLKASLSTILVIAVGLGGAIATATDFSNNVLELGKKFGVELVHPQGTQSAQSPHSQSTQTVDVNRLEGGH